MRYQFSNVSCEVHMWIVHLNGLENQLLHAPNILSEQEQDHARQYSDPECGLLYQAAHISLREILSRYIRLPAKHIRFIAGNRNKPFLEPGQSGDPVYFNLSYCEEYILLGVSNADYLGVDIEKIRHIDDIHSFAGNYFSGEEQQCIFQKSNTEEQEAILFTFWVMKEAVIKSLADGFAKPLPSYSVRPFLANPCCTPDFDITNTWFIKQLVVDKHYKAAIAIKANQVKLSVFKYGEN